MSYTTLLLGPKRFIYFKGPYNVHTLSLALSLYLCTDIKAQIINVFSIQHVASTNATSASTFFVPVHLIIKIEIHMFPAIHNTMAIYFDMVWTSDKKYVHKSGPCLGFWKLSTQYWTDVYTVYATLLVVCCLSMKPVGTLDYHAFQNLFSKFYGTVGVISWLLFHLIWKNYVLYWDFDLKSWIVDISVILLMIIRHKRTFLVKISV